eukprot:SAG31_NODE_4649_length_3068_cov_6.932428_1_plen_342_part_00
MYMNEWDRGRAFGAVSHHYGTRNGPAPQGDAAPAQLPNSMGYADAARTIQEDTRRRLLRNMQTSADSIFHRDSAAVRSSGDSESAVAPSFSTEYNSQYYAYAPSRPFVPRPMSYEVPLTARESNVSALFDHPQDPVPEKEPTSTEREAAEVPVESTQSPVPPAPPDVAPEPQNKTAFTTGSLNENGSSAVSIPWRRTRPNKKNWNCRHTKVQVAKLRRPDVVSRDLPDSSIAGALNFDRAPFHCYGRGNAVHSLPGGELAANISLRQGCARDRTTHNVNAAPYAKVFRYRHSGADLAQVDKYVQVSPASRFGHPAIEDFEHCVRANLTHAENPNRAAEQVV